MRGNATPTIERPEQAVDGGLQCRRVVAQVAGFSERLVDCRFEQDHVADELAPARLRVRQFLPGEGQHAGKSARYRNPQIGE
jgi:hypothetical protein